MISKELQKAREYEEREASMISAGDRPVFHFTPLAGWLNDPNGLSYYGGRYHLFYQYHPYNSYWGPMHWGHAVSDDMINWQYLPAALAPDTDYDGAGCFSGSAITLTDGRQLLMYTGCCDDGKDPLGKSRWREQQCIAVSVPAAAEKIAAAAEHTAAAADAQNGRSEKQPEAGSAASLLQSAYAEPLQEYIKYEGNPVITEADLPEGSDIYEFRDPYIWKAANGTYRVLAAAGSTGEITPEGTYRSDKGTRILMFRSDDGFRWSFDKVLFEDDRRIGIMWECPNFFRMGGRQILIASPMDMAMEEEAAAGSVRFPQGNNVCYITGNYDEKTETFAYDREDGRFIYEPVDCGLDFYAPQVMQTPDGRHIMIGWMQDPKTGNFVSADDMTDAKELKHASLADASSGYVHGEPESRIFGQMTVPRELTLRGNRLIQWPVRELEEYRSGDALCFSMDIESETKRIDGICGRAIDMTIELSPKFASATGMCSLDEFVIRFAEDDDHFVQLSYRPDSSTVSVDRSRSGQADCITKRRSIRVRERRGSINLRILIDRWSAEVFVNGGEQVMSLTYYTPESAAEISFSSEGAAVMDVTAYKMRRMSQPEK